MADISPMNGNHHPDAVALTVKDNNNSQNQSPTSDPAPNCSFSVPFMQKIIAEVVGTYFLMFAGCASMSVNLNHDKVVTLPGIAFAWGFAVMILVYSIGHISGAHLNPAVSIAFATCKRFSWKQVPAYVAAQLFGSILASGTLKLLFHGKEDQFVGTIPSGSDTQAFVVEFIITFYLMFVISGVATDNRAIGELAGLAIGAIVVVNALISGPITGCSMNPARSLGPAIIWNKYKSLWVYMVAPVAGAVSGAWIYNTVRFTDKPLREITKSASFLKSSRNSFR